MAIYKVIQDVEAEDKLLGPLTLRQFIYAAIAAISAYLSFIVITKHIFFMLIVFLPIIFVCVFFAFPWKKDQPTEVWALAKIRFMVKPHKRIWDQSGVKELVTITAPKAIRKNFTNGLTREQVQSRLKGLAETIDTRGWATKNVNVNLSSPTVITVDDSNSDRLVAADTLPQTVPEIDVRAADDVLDEKNNQTAAKFDEMIKKTSVEQRQQIVNEVKQASEGKQPSGPRPDYWFLNQAAPPILGSIPQGYSTFDNSQVVTPGSTDDSNLPQYASTDDELALSEELKKHRDESIDTYRAHMKTIEPLNSKKRKKKVEETPAAVEKPKVTQTSDPAILALANNNDLNVATIARQANKTNKPEPPPPDEVVITLH